MLRVDNLYPLALARPHLDEALVELRGSRAAVLDLRPTAAATSTPRWPSSAGCSGPSRCTVRGANWEQTGVVPDLPCGEAEALERALEHLGSGA